MRFGGLQKLTLLDFPGHVACTVFTQGCNFRCPFCHNSSLVLGTESLDESEILAFLRKRQGLLDGVALTGGEPLLAADTGDFLKKVRDLGYLIKLDTNGSFPNRLEALLEAGLVDYVAMDIKNSPVHYATTAGADGFLDAVSRSAALLMEGRVPYEFRTTVVDELHTPEDFHAIGQWLRGASQYFLQAFVDSGKLLCPGLHGASEEKMRQYLTIVSEYIPNSHIRGLS